MCAFVHVETYAFRDFNPCNFSDWWT